ncbi:histidine kinase [Plantibacter sp. YIM 135249]|uniref:histidine kinase n=1 Tax=Plantibacter sp. YIM 135249 TaxID=3423918 RepID=UPI003D33ED40
MDGRRWWDAAFGGTAIVVGVVVWLSEADDSAGTIGRLGAWAVLLLLCACYYTFGRRQLERASSGYLFQIVLIVGVAVGAAFSPNMLTMQVVMIPLLWVLTHDTRTAVILNIVSAVALAIGFTVGIHGYEGALAQAAFIQGISLVFSIALGLWISRIHDYGAERARLLQQLQNAQAETERASRDAGAAAERERMALDIHDTIAQSLTSVVMLAQRARAESPVAPDTIDLIETTAREALGEARALVATNAGFPASDVGLRDSLLRLATRFQRETGIAVTVEAGTTPLPRPIEVVLLRTAQEGLANVRKHARAARVVVTLSVGSVYAAAGMSAMDPERAALPNGGKANDRPSDARSMVSLTVRDDGVGFPADGATGRGFGIEGMQSRVELLGGGVTTSNPAEGGALLRVDVPLIGHDGTAAGAPSDDRSIAVPMPMPVPVSMPVPVPNGSAPPIGSVSGRAEAETSDRTNARLLAASVAEHLRTARSTRVPHEPDPRGPAIDPGPLGRLGRISDPNGRVDPAPNVHAEPASTPGDAHIPDPESTTP